MLNKVTKGYQVTMLPLCDYFSPSLGGNLLGNLLEVANSLCTGRLEITISYFSFHLLSGFCFSLLDPTQQQQRTEVLSMKQPNNQANKLKEQQQEQQVILEPGKEGTFTGYFAKYHGRYYTTTRDCFAKRDKLVAELKQDISSSFLTILTT